MNNRSQKRGGRFALLRADLLVKNLKPYKHVAGILSALALVSALFSAMTPFFAGNLIDGLINPKMEFFGYTLPIAPAFFFFFLWFGAQFIMHSTDWFLDYKSRYVYEKIIADYFVKCIGYTIDLPISFHKTHKVGEIENRFYSAANGLATILSDVVVTLLPQFLGIFIALIVTFLINPLLSMLLVLSVAVYLWIIIKLGPEYTKLVRRMRRSYHRAFGEAYDTLLNAQSVKQAGAESYEKKRMHRVFHLRSLKNLELYLSIWQRMNSSQRVISVIAQSLIYLLSIVFILRGEMTVGQLVMFNGYVALFLGPFAILAKNWHSVQNGLANIERAEKITSQKPEPYDSPNAVILPDIKGKVEFKDVSFTYGKKQKKVLSDISFKSEAGHIIALVGESGVGKTTLIDLVSRYFEPTKGEVLIDGHNVKNLNLRFLRSKIAVVPQEILLFNDTISVNIRYGNFGASPRKIKKAATAAHANEFIMQFPKKYKQIVGERGVKLSTGQKQRVAIARAVLRDPRILILDEPTSALDAVTERLVEDALRNLMRGRTTFIIAHRLSTVRHADKILVLEKGRIVEQGTHDELIQIENGVYKHLYELQIGLKA